MKSMLSQTSSSLFVIFIIVSFCACGTDKNNAMSTSNQVTKTNQKYALDLTGEELFAKHCKLCHGVNGKLGLSGAKDLTVSILNLEEKRLIITNGKGAMTPFKSVLKPKEIDRVAEFTMNLIKN